MLNNFGCEWYEWWRRGAASSAGPREVCTHVRMYARMRLQTRGHENKLLSDISDLKPKIYG